MTGTTTRPPRWGDMDFDDRLAALPKAEARAVLDAAFGENDMAARMGRRLMMVDEYQDRLRKILHRPDPEKSAAPVVRPAAAAPDPDGVDERPLVPDPSQENAPEHRKAFAEKFFGQAKDVAKETLINQVRLIGNGAKGINRYLLALSLICLRRTVADELEALRKRVAELESRPEMKYCGVFEMERVYSPGQFVTHGGSLWHCQAATVGGRPGSSDSWRLAVKHGRDIRQGRDDT